MRPFPLVLSAPSGGGKTTIARHLLERRSDVGYSISCTTRAPRPGEVDGVDYHFISVEEFERRVEAGEFAEWAHVHANRYGTLKSEITRVLESGRHVMMDIDVQGARQLAVALPEAVTIFVIPPSIEVLVSRLTGRGSESPEDFLLRMRNARTELLEAERYQYVVENDSLELALRHVGEIIDAEAGSLVRRPPLGSQVGALVTHLLQDLSQYA